MPPLFCKKPFHQAGHAYAYYAYAGISRQMHRISAQYTQDLQYSPLDKLGSLRSIFFTSKIFRGMQDDIQGELKMIFKIYKMMIKEKGQMFAGGCRGRCSDLGR